MKASGGGRWEKHRKGLKSWLDAVLSFIYPDACQVCRVQPSAAHAGYVCEQCRSSVRYIKPPFCDRCGLPFSGDITSQFECANCRELELCFTSARAAVAASGVVLEILHRYKYQRALWFEPFLARLLVEKSAQSLQQKDWDLIVPVPLHPLKKREREFNQAERLAKRLSRATGIPISSVLLERATATQTQTRLSRSQRAVNVRSAFRVCGGKDLNGQRIVLVDDVLTTGATTSACAKTLRAKGCGQVSVWTVARGM
ncbi:MAG: ComF family protein [Verrucomicrobia bacterium]|nr:ComF family protein [Verrucomicrobiota bacterium]